MTKTFDTPCLPPTANRQWRSAVIGNRLRTYLVADARDWREVFQVEFKVWMLKNKVKLILTGPVELKIVVVVKHDRDCDSSLKPILDGLQGVLYTNDRQVTHVDLYKEKGEPRLFITINN